MLTKSRAVLNDQMGCQPPKGRNQTPTAIHKLVKKISNKKDGSLQKIFGPRPQSRQERLFQPYVNPFLTMWQCLERVRLYGVAIAH